MEVKDLITKLNDKLPTGFKALMGGSAVLKANNLINREIDDVDIIITNNIFQSDKEEEFKKVYEIIVNDLFQLFTVLNLSSSNYSGDNGNFEDYKFNFKINFSCWTPTDKVNTLNIIVQNNFVPEDYYSKSKFNDIPCCSLNRILDAKRHYNRPKDKSDFLEMQYNMFYKK